MTGLSESQPIGMEGIADTVNCSRKLLRSAMANQGSHHVKRGSETLATYGSKENQGQALNKTRSPSREQLRSPLQQKLVGTAEFCVRLADVAESGRLLNK